MLCPRLTLSRSDPSAERRRQSKTRTRETKRPKSQRKKQRRRSRARGSRRIRLASLAGLNDSIIETVSCDTLCCCISLSLQLLQLRRWIQFSLESMCPSLAMVFLENEYNKASFEQLGSVASELVTFRSRHDRC